MPDLRKDFAVKKYEETVQFNNKIRGCLIKLTRARYVIRFIKIVIALGVTVSSTYIQVLPSISHAVTFFSALSVMFVSVEGVLTEIDKRKRNALSSNYQIISKITNALSDDEITKKEFEGLVLGNSQIEINVG